MSNRISVVSLCIWQSSLLILCKGLVRFTPKSDSTKVLIGQPTDESVDVGVAVREGKEVSVDVFSGSSVLSPGEPSGQTAVIDKVLSPLTQVEAGTIRCIGLNVSIQVRPTIHAILIVHSTKNMPRKQRWIYHQFRQFL